jgi:uncharacterized protein (DUF1800 family)
MSQQDLNLMAHLMRRAGFGATRDELEAYLARGYDTVVEELLHPDQAQAMPDDLIRRYHVDMSELRQVDSAGAYWLYRMITTSCPLQEKMTLFWHGLFATGYTKLNQARALLNQIDMFRRVGLGPFNAILLELSKDPAMLLWLDNNENHKDAINENYGRELLELFSMGIGHYTEADIKACARAFTGWTLKNAEYMAVRASKDSIWPYGRINWHFEYRDWDHDDGEKTFLGETGHFNGEEIIEIIARQEATARFISTRLFQFFAADTLDADSEAVIQAMMASYVESHYDIRAVLRTLFTSDYFKSEQARYARVKSPVELLVGAIRLAGSYQTPTLGANQLAFQAFFMGQGPLAPPTVEGWHEGMEWIDSGSLVERINFVAKEVSDVSKPGVQALIERLAAADGGVLTPAQLVDGCLDLMGPLAVDDETHAALIDHAARQGALHLSGRQPGDDSEQRVGNMLRMIAATREYQLA